MNIFDRVPPGANFSPLTRMFMACYLEVRWSETLHHKGCRVAQAEAYAKKFATAHWQLAAQIAREVETFVEHNAHAETEFLSPGEATFVAKTLQQVVAKHCEVIGDGWR